MKKISRRTNKTREAWSETREAWSEDKRSAESDLLIPPCDLWHGDINTASEVDITDIPSTSASGDLNSQCWAFMGAVGGVGTTTLAVQMAYELAKKQSRIDGRISRAREPKICIVDLDFESGSCIHHLDVEPGLTLDDLSRDALCIDSLMTEAFLNTHASGISVLAAPNMIGANARVDTPTVLALLDAVNTMFPYVILDLPRQWEPWSLAAVSGSDFVGLLSDLTIPSLHMARTKRNQLGELLQSKNPCEVILNKYERRSFKNTLQLHDAEIALQCELFGMVCEDSTVTQEAINCGEPVGSIRSNSRYAKDSRKLLEQILFITNEQSQNEGQTTRMAS